MTSAATTGTPVPAVDGAGNVTTAQVIGNRSDAHDTNTIQGRMHMIEDHFHGPARCYPTLAGGVTATAGAAWTLGNFVEVVPASTITDDFDIHHIVIEDISGNDVCQLELYYGAGDTFAGCARFVKTAAQDSTSNVPMQTPIIPANSRVRAKLATAAGATTATFSIKYHEY